MPPPHENVECINWESMMDKSVGIVLSIVFAVLAVTLVGISFVTSTGALRTVLLVGAVVLVAACGAMLAVAVKGTSE